MALIQCPDCAEQVSSNAPACPKCGCPLGTSARPAIPAATPVPPKKTVSSGVKAFGCLGLLIVCYAVSRASQLPKDDWRRNQPPAAAPVEARPSSDDGQPVLPGQKARLVSTITGEPVYVAMSQEAHDRMMRTFNDRDDMGLRQLLGAGLISREPEGTSVLALSGGPGVFSGLRKVRILEGANAGTEVLVAVEFLKH